MRVHQGGTFKLESHYLDFGYWEKLNAWLDGGIYVGLSDNALQWPGESDLAMRGKRLALKFQAWVLREGRFSWLLDTQYGFNHMTALNSADLTLQAYHWNVLTGMKYRIGAFTFYGAAGFAGVDGKYPLENRLPQRFQVQTDSLWQASLSYAFGEGDSIGFYALGQQSKGAVIYFRHQYP